MPDPTIYTKSELLLKVETSWTALHALLTRLTDDPVTTLHDENGWTVKDHLTHLAVWEDSVAALFQGKPRYLALGIDESMYAKGDFDAMNARIRELYEDIPLASALTKLRSSHRTLMAFVEGLSDADLDREVAHLFPHAPGDERRVTDIIFDNTARHFEEHRAWIEALTA
ncbi:MAG TPA: ClbS/DfsB family four-helix bundle protein [Anaerolineales bacterium]|nr:ClbS/DfsB family four-helix bundle protein [Anaerolineales bacterium]